MRKPAALVGALLVGAAAAVYVFVAPGPAADHPAAWDARVLPLVRFVEAQRGLTFKHPIAVEFLDDSAFQKKVAVPAPESKKDKADAERTVSTLRALGLVRGKVDLSAAFDTLTKSDVVGLYVPEKKTVFVRGTQLDPYARSTLVHELTHGLQDQYFDLAKLKDDAPGGDTTAVTSLIEGDAVRIEESYQKELSAPDQKLYETAQATALKRSKDAAGIPEVLSDFFGFPYAFGPVLLDSLVLLDGNKSVDAAFRSPPSSEAQVVDPITYPTFDQPTKVPAPELPTGATKLDHAVPLGMVSLFAVLSSQLDYSTAWTAVQGWTGDAYVPYKQGGTTCVVADVAMKDAASTSRLADAAHHWAGHLPGATVSSSNTTVRIRSCDPGDAGAPLPTRKPSPFAVLAARAQFIHGAVGSGAGISLARCVADGLITALGPKGYGELTSDELTPAQLAQIQKLVGGSADRCRATG